MSMEKDITKKNITTEMSNSFLDYAMSVIVARALPDVRLLPLGPAPGAAPDPLRGGRALLAAAPRRCRRQRIRLAARLLPGAADDHRRRRRWPRTGTSARPDHRR